MQIDIPSPASTFRHWSPVNCRARGTDCSSVSQACRKSWLSRVMFVCVSRWGLVTAGGFMDDRITWLVVVVPVLQIHPLARQYRSQPGPSFQSERIFLQSFYILVNYIIFPPKKVTHRICTALFYFSFHVNWKQRRLFLLLAKNCRSFFLLKQI